MHYITSLSMQLEGKERSVLTEFYPQQNRKLSETLGVEPIEQTWWPISQHEYWRCVLNC